MAISSTENKKKFSRNYCQSVLLIASVLIGNAFTPATSLAVESDITATDKSNSISETFTWTNLYTKKTVEIPSGWTVTMSLQNNLVFTVFHEIFSGAEITLFHEKTTDDVHTYAADMLKVYPKRHIRINHTEFYKADTGTFWLASGKLESNPNMEYDVAIHNKDGRMWIVSSLYPEWIMTNSDWSSVLSAVNNSAL